MKQVLKIEEFFPQIIATRVSVKEFLCKQVNPNTSSVELDFSNVIFISRSAADEFVTFFEQKSLKHKFLNLNENIKKMFKAVNKTHSYKKIRSFRDVPIVSFNSYSDLNDFLAVL